LRTRFRFWILPSSGSAAGSAWLPRIPAWLLGCLRFTLRYLPHTTFTTTPRFTARLRVLLPRRLYARWFVTLPVAAPFGLRVSLPWFTLRFGSRAVTAFGYALPAVLDGSTFCLPTGSAVATGSRTRFTAAHHTCRHRLRFACRTATHAAATPVARLHAVCRTAVPRALPRAYLVAGCLPVLTGLPFPRSGWFGSFAVVAFPVACRSGCAYTTLPAWIRFTCLVGSHYGWFPHAHLQLVPAVTYHTCPHAHISPRYADWIFRTYRTVVRCCGFIRFWFPGLYPAPFVLRLLRYGLLPGCPAHTLTTCWVVWMRLYPPTLYAYVCLRFTGYVTVRSRILRGYAAAGLPHAVWLVYHTTRGWLHWLRGLPACTVHTHTPPQLTRFTTHARFGLVATHLRIAVYCVCVTCRSAGYLVTTFTRLRWFCATTRLLVGSSLRLPPAVYVPLCPRFGFFTALLPRAVYTHHLVRFPWFYTHWLRLRAVCCYRSPVCYTVACVIHAFGCHGFTVATPLPPPHITRGCTGLPAHTVAAVTHLLRLPRLRRTLALYRLRAHAVPVTTVAVTLHRTRTTGSLVMRCGCGLRGLPRRCRDTYADLRIRGAAFTYRLPGYHMVATFIYPYPSGLWLVYRSWLRRTFAHTFPAPRVCRCCYGLPRGYWLRACPIHLYTFSPLRLRLPAVRFWFSQFILPSTIRCRFWFTWILCWLVYACYSLLLAYRSGLRSRLHAHVTCGYRTWLIHARLPHAHAPPFTGCPPRTFVPLPGWFTHRAVCQITRITRFAFRTFYMRYRTGLLLVLLDSGSYHISYCCCGYARYGWFTGFTRLPFSAPFRTRITLQFCDSGSRTPLVVTLRCAARTRAFGCLPVLLPPGYTHHRLVFCRILPYPTPHCLVRYGWFGYIHVTPCHYSLLPATTAWLHAHHTVPARAPQLLQFGLRTTTARFTPRSVYGFVHCSAWFTVLPDFATVAALRYVLPRCCCLHLLLLLFYVVDYVVVLLPLVWFTHHYTRAPGWFRWIWFVLPDCRTRFRWFALRTVLDFRFTTARLVAGCVLHAPRFCCGLQFCRLRSAAFARFTHAGLHRALRLRFLCGLFTGCRRYCVYTYYRFTRLPRWVVPLRFGSALRMLCLCCPRITADSAARFAVPVLRSVCGSTVLFSSHRFGWFCVHYGLLPRWIYVSWLPLHALLPAAAPARGLVRSSRCRLVYGCTLPHLYPVACPVHVLLPHCLWLRFCLRIAVSAFTVAPVYVYAPRCLLRSAPLLPQFCRGCVQRCCAFAHLHVHVAVVYRFRSVTGYVCTHTAARSATVGSVLLHLPVDSGLRFFPHTYCLVTAVYVPLGCVSVYVRVACVCRLRLPRLRVSVPTFPLPR